MPQEVIVYDQTYPKYERRVFEFQITDLHEPINMERMRKERLERARAHMREAGIAVMLLLDNANFRYTTSHAWLGYASGGAQALVPLEGDPIVFAHLLPAAIQERREDMATFMKPENIRAGGMAPGMRTKCMHPPIFERAANGFARQIKETLEEMGLDKEVLTLDMHEDIIPALEKAGIRTAVNDEVLVRAQEIKTQDEIACFRACGALADQVHYELAKYAEPGKTELELAGYMNFMAMKYGSDSAPNCFVASGQHTCPNYRTSTRKMLRVGDIFFADVIQASFCGYKSCCYRTYSCVTPPSQAAKDAMKEMVDIVYAALSECKPGKTTADMMKHWPKDKEFLNGGNAGHGLGLKNYGPPWFGPRRAYEQHPYELKEGHVFAIEPERGIGDGQGVRLEEMVVVTKTGCEVLTHAPLEILTCPLR